MLPKSERLTKEDFTDKRPKVFFRGEFFDIATIVLPTQKFACVISKKTLKRAVDRNSVKRQIINAIKETDTPKTTSFVIYPKKESLFIPYSILKEELSKAFDTLH